MASVSVSGADQVKKALAQARTRVETEVAAAVQAEADDVVTDAQANVRIDSGDLRDSISAVVSGLSANIRPRSSLSQEDPADHATKAAVNEFGRSSDSGQPYMVPAAEASRARWPKRAADAVKRGVEG